MGFLKVFILLILIIILFQLTIKLKFFFNVKNNSGKIELKFIGIKIISYQISIKHQCLRLTKNNGKNIYIPIEFTEQSIEKYNNFKTILFKKTYFKTIVLYLNFGLKNDAFLTTFVTGNFDVLSKIFYSVLKTKKSEVLMNLKVYNSFNSNVIKIGFKAKISISVFDLLWSCLEAKITQLIKMRKIKRFMYAK